MDRNERKAKKDRTSEPDHDLLKHIKSLGLQTVEAYIEWCAKHGFSRRTDKHWRVRLKERVFANRTIADARPAQKKQELRTPAKVIERIFIGDLQEGEVTQPAMKAVFRAFKSAQESRLSLRAFHELLQHVCSRSDLLSGNSVIRPYGWQAGNTYVDGLLALARHSRSSIRPVADWKPQTHNARRQFSSLARHLFAEWPVPEFMDSVWFAGNGKGAVERQDWFLRKRPVKTPCGGW